MTAREQSITRSLSMTMIKMLCSIADLIVEVPAAGGMASRCQDYLYCGNDGADIVIRTELYNPGKYPEDISQESLAYMESCRQFCAHLLKFNGLYLHASAVELEGKAYLFSANSGTGKSTHARLWQNVFGDAAQVFNDDKPALRCMDGIWYAYGTPWCGKDGININKKVPLAGICFLKQARENKIRELRKAEVLQRLLPQTIYRNKTARQMDMLLQSIDDLLGKIPAFELECTPDPEAAQLSSATMRRKAEEMGL